MSTNGGPFEVLVSTVNSFLVVNQLTPGVTYSFKVESRNAYDYSAYSEELSLLCAFIPEIPEYVETYIE